MVSRRRRIACVLVCVALSGVGPAAHGQPAASELERGLELYERGEYAAAAEAFEAAHEADPSPPILFAWAQALRLAGDCATAIDLYLRFLETGPTTQDARAAAQAIDRCDEDLAVPPGEVLDEGPRVASLAAGGDAGDPPADAALAAAAPPPPPRLRIGVFTRVDADVPRRGGLAAPGVVIAVARGWDVFGGALFGGHRGLELGARVAIGGAWIRPYVAAAVPLFFVDGERVAGRGALGLLVEPHRRARVTLEVGGVYALSAPDEVAAAALLASVGAEVWLW